jgi:Predicted phosphatases
MNILLDLDGTLTDPRTGFIASIRYALESLGLEVPPDSTIASRIGPPLEETLAEFLGENHRNDLSSAVALYRERYSASGLYENTVYDGIPRALAQLHERGDRLYLATSKPGIFAGRILEHFGLSSYFTSIYGSGLDGSLSDKTQLIAHILEREGLSLRSSVMIGDRMYDVKGALRNGISVYGALWGYGSRLELEAAGAEIFLAQPSDLGTCRLLL